MNRSNNVSVLNADSSFAFITGYRNTISWKTVDDSVMSKNIQLTLQEKKVCSFPANSTVTGFVHHVKNSSPDTCTATKKSAAMAVARKH